MTDQPFPIESPCVSICMLDEQDICTGCLRSLAEIGRWASANDREKMRVMNNIEGRRRRALDN
ncbi:MAG: DUF1289 domain-containing protein [SAR86 cluster bacterium]|uniref:DUF1289 domain-containing protein n=1 Tax=SAR86 cluster bacterium TaxID=2030880 RepID=A0A972VU53_9GAMM|nr:DUF1289 domain-containing protein [SAR86 cluster bacterium]